jgi:hypothetical protein
MDAEKIAEIREYLSDTASNGPRSGLNLRDVEATLRVYCFDLLAALPAPHAPEPPKVMAPPPPPVQPPPKAV